MVCSEQPVKRIVGWIVDSNRKKNEGLQRKYLKLSPVSLRAWEGVDEHGLPIGPFDADDIMSWIGDLATPPPPPQRKYLSTTCRALKYRHKDLSLKWPDSIDADILMVLERIALEQAHRS